MVGRVLCLGKEEFVFFYRVGFFCFGKSRRFIDEIGMEEGCRIFRRRYWYRVKVFVLELDDIGF